VPGQGQGEGASEGGSGGVRNFKRFRKKGARLASGNSFSTLVPFSQVSPSLRNAAWAWLVDHPQGLRQHTAMLHWCSPVTLVHPLPPVNGPCSGGVPLFWDITVNERTVLDRTVLNCTVL